MEKHPEDTLARRKFAISRRVGYLAVPRAFRRLLREKLISPHQYAVITAAWDFFQSPANKSTKGFTLSRAQLAQESGVAEKQVYEALRRFESLQCLFRKPGKVTEAASFVWNVEKIEELGGACIGEIQDLYRRDTSTCIGETQALVSERYSVYITTLLNTINTSITAKTDGDNSDAPSGAFLSEGEVGAAAMAAVESNWHMTGGKFPLHEISLILGCHTPPRGWGSIKNLPGYLFTLLSDGSFKYQLAKDNPHFPTDEAVLLHQLDNQLTKEHNQ